MSLTLAELITRSQSQLLDDGTLFTTAMLTAAAREALRDFNLRAPIHAGNIVEVTASQKTYELSTSDGFPSLVLDIDDVLKNDDNAEDDDPLDFDAIFEDNRVYIRLRTAESSGNLLIRYTQAHTVQDLDSETESTMNADQDQILVDGICGYACMYRATGRVESLNLFNSRTLPDYSQASARFFQAFGFGLSRYTMRQAPRAERRTSSWLDDDIRYTSSSQAGSLRDL